MALRLPCAGRHARAEGPVTGCNLPAKPLPQAVLEFYRQSGVGALCTATLERIARIEPITVTYEDGVFVLGYRATGRRGRPPMSRWDQIVILDHKHLERTSRCSFLQGESARV